MPKSPCIPLWKRVKEVGYRRWPPIVTGKMPVLPNPGGHAGPPLQKRFPYRQLFRSFWGGAWGGRFCKNALPESFLPLSSR
jgi:hypothetical protein